jgi:cardiolipin synthase C
MPQTFSIDDSRIFIGSFNFDPRAARLNTELAFVIESPALTCAISDAFATRLRASPYKLRLAAVGSLRCIEHAARKEVVHVTEPGTTFWTRFGVSFLSALPIEWPL